jgi:hypothetical protein
MALFGSKRDVSIFRSMSEELINDIITQQIGYYKVVLSETPPNTYGEAITKQYVGPVLINTLIERGDFTVSNDNFGPDTARIVTYRFLKTSLETANVYPEVGDVIMYNELYYEVDNVNENQLILGKDPDYSYSTGLENFGGSYSLILQTHLTTPERLGIAQFRI